MGKPTWTIHDPSFDADLIHPLHAVYPWCGHRWFAYDLVRFLKPSRIAELGVHWGTSFFAFCQALRDGKLDSEIVGVDTWCGDDHTGPYGEDVIDTVRRTLRERFPEQRVRLLRKTFDEALADVADESVDVMHIDGFHTYEAVEHDFTTWLPKLAPEGMILFHDVAESTGYGSAQFWKDVTAQHPGFMFGHSWGLGVLFPKGDAVLRQLRARNLSEKIKLYEYKGELDLARRQNADLGKMAEERYEALQRQKDVIEEAQQMARERHELLQRQKDVIEEAQQMARERFATMKQQSEKIESLKAASKEREEEMRAQRRALTETERERDRLQDEANRRRTQVADLSSRLEAVESRATALGEQAARRQASIEALTAKLDDRREALRKASERVGEMQDAAASARQRESSLRGTLAAAEKRLASASAMAEERLERLRSLNERIVEGARALKDVESKLAAARDILARRDGRIERLTEAVAERDRLIAEQNAMINELKRRLDDLELDVELLNTRTGHVEDVLDSHRREIKALLDTEPGRQAAEELASASVGRVRIES